MIDCYFSLTVLAFYIFMKRVTRQSKKNILLHCVDDNFGAKK